MGTANPTATATMEDVETLFNFLQGTVPDGFVLPAEDIPHLTAQQAFSVVYVLQEAIGLISDQYELCDRCKCLYDSHAEGSPLDTDTLADEGLQRRPGAAEMYHVCDDCFYRCVEGLPETEELD